MEMIESRINIKYSDPIKLSAQESLDCNYYNQGCGGGYGFLVSKYYTENELVSEECYPYMSRDGMCGKTVSKCESQMTKKYKVNNY
jgi:cathepsin C